jgi:molybdate transport system regulatory protein
LSVSFSLHRPAADKIRLPASRNFLCAVKQKTDSSDSISLQPRFRAMRGKEIAFGPGKAELLGLVAETGSIGKAASRMNMSYMRAWSLIQTMNACFKKPVIAALRGGHERGGAALTETGRLVLGSYRQMEKAGLRAVQADWRTLQKLLRR